ncbi:ATP-binding protein [Saccharospirillum alexandrii]|uniref:sensor histidine kinase n=1 Tax=Saccharospirillum alexandrii TaxID=2448477 RepID=UPI0037355FDD
MEALWNYIVGPDFMPHGHCYYWRSDLLALHAGSDAVIAIAYFSIPLALAKLWYDRADLGYRWIIKMFAAFIVACGTTHLVGIWNIWNADYYFQGIVKLITAGISLVTAILIWPLLPKVLAIPSPAMLTERNEALNEEMLKRTYAEQQLRLLYESLEQTVEERTQELQQAKRALELQIQTSEQVKQRLQSIFESAPNGMIVVSRDGTILQANSMAHSIFHYDVGELSGKRVEQLVPADSRKPHQANREHYISSPTKRMMGDRRDLSGLCADGKTVPVEIGLNPVTGSSEGEVVASVVDVSERRNYERKIEQRSEALERSNRELKEFAFIASHDLREPLRKIISFSKLLLSKDYGNFTGEGETFASYVVDAAERMRELLDSLLSYSRVTSHGGQFVVTDLNDVVREVLSDLQMTIEESQARFEVASLDQLTMDPSQIRQLLQNIVSNALKYRQPEQPPIIRIHGEPVQGDRYRLTIEDNGIGFENQYNEQIFEVFKRLHGRDSYPGTGMGLAICRKIVDRHQGVIRAESSPGKGTRFIIELPVNPHIEAAHDF